AGDSVAAVLAQARERLLAGGFSEIDYLELRADADLASLAHYDGRPARLLAAARLGTVRLIDNMSVPAKA
ncbi:pantoate--beta-alanine ligase, partial [Nguyenibacter vanlangensis]